MDTGCFASFLAETRSSNSTTSTLSDFTLGQFSFCEKPSLTTQVSKSSGDVGDSFTDTATLSGSKGAVTGTVAFSVCGPTDRAPALHQRRNQRRHDHDRERTGDVELVHRRTRPVTTAFARSSRRLREVTTWRRPTPTRRTNASRPSLRSIHVHEDSRRGQRLRRRADWVHRDGEQQRHRGCQGRDPLGRAPWRQRRPPGPLDDRRLNRKPGVVRHQRSGWKPAADPRGPADQPWRQAQAWQST